MRGAAVRGPPTAPPERQCAKEQELGLQVGVLLWPWMRTNTEHAAWGTGMRLRPYHSRPIISREGRSR